MSQDERALKSGAQAVSPDDIVFALNLADSGHGGACSIIGSMYASGWGVPEDPARAAVYLRTAAEAGIKDAQHNLGDLYRQGKGVPQDSREAVAWFTKAAD